MRCRIQVALLALLCAAVVGPINAQEPACALPTEDWEIVAPEDVGLDGTLLSSGEVYIADDLPFIRGMLIVRSGCLAYEHYFGDAGVDVADNVFSVTKSVTATLIGIAVADGLIGSVHDSIADYLDIAADDPRAAITLRHLLWMLSGLGWDEGRLAHIGGMLARTRDEVDFILNLPLDHVPGTVWNYSTADSHLLSAVLGSATDGPVRDYADRMLFGPIGIVPVEWQVDANGVNFGGTQLFLTPRDMAKFGLLILNDGLWGDEEIVSEEWIAFMTRPQLADPSDLRQSYAAHWWHTMFEGYPPMSAAVGYGGQIILIVPDFDLIVVVTAESTRGTSYISGEASARQVEAILDFIAATVLPAVLPEPIR